MAERFGGRYSPGGSGRGDDDGDREGRGRDAAAFPERGAGRPGEAGLPPGTGKFPPQIPPRRPFEGRRPRRAGARINLLFFTAIPFAFRAFGQPPLGLALSLGAAGLIVLAAWLTREGLRAQEAYEARPVARRPAIPRKLFGSALTGLALALGGYVPGAGLLPPILFALLGAGLHAFAFGPDPLRDKGVDGIDMMQSDRVARAVAEGERYLVAMTEAIGRSGDRALAARVERFQQTAREMFRTVEADPRDLTAARRYLGVYLMGARDATVKFAELWSRSRDAQARADYEALLDDLETNFSARTRTLLLDDRSDLNVEIEVLRDRLKREGLDAG